MSPVCFEIRASILGPIYLLVMEGKDEVRPACPTQRPVGAGFALDRPADPEKSRQDPSSAAPQLLMRPES